VSDVVRLLPVARIKFPDATRSRWSAEPDPQTVADYAEEMAGGATFPPIDVYEVARGEFVLTDGRHRLEATRAAGGARASIACRVFRGDLRAAQLAAAAANARQDARPRSNQDKRRAVLLALAASGGEWAAAQVARHTAVSLALVLKLTAAYAGALRSGRLAELVVGGAEALQPRGERADVDWRPDGEELVQAPPAEPDGGERCLLGPPGDEEGTEDAEHDRLVLLERVWRLLRKLARHAAKLGSTPEGLLAEWRRRLEREHGTGGGA
jgi:hypothetical protein